MADEFKVRLVGLPNFQRELNELSSDMHKFVVRSAVAAAGRVFAKRATELAPVSNLRRKRHVSGTLKRNIIFVRKKRQSKPGFEAGAVIGRGGVRNRKKAPAFFFLPFYWRWVEGGHRIVPRGQKIAGGERVKALRRARFDKAGGGRTTAVQFLEKAFHSVGDVALAAFNKKIIARIEKANQKKRLLF